MHESVHYSRSVPGGCRTRNSTGCLATPPTAKYFRADGRCAGWRKTPTSHLRVIWRLRLREPVVIETSSMFAGTILNDMIISSQDAASLSLIEIPFLKASDECHNQRNLGRKIERAD